MNNYVLHERTRQIEALLEKIESRRREMRSRNVARSTVEGCTTATAAASFANALSTTV